MMSSSPEGTDGVPYNGGVDWDDSVLPITDNITVERVKYQAPKTSNMWFAAAYNVTAIIGVGVLGLPHAMVFLTWGPGVVVLCLAFAMTFFTMKQLIELHEFEYINLERRYETYHDLGERAYPTWGFWIVVPLQMVVEVSLDILFTVAAGEAMNRIYDRLTDGHPVHIFVWFAAFAVIQICLCVVVPDFDSIKWIVVFAAIMSVCYSSIAWMTIVAKCDDKGDVHHRLPRYLTVDHDASDSDRELTHMDLVFRAFNSIGVIAFAYAAHNVVLEIQNGIPSTPKRPSEDVMFRGVVVTYVVVALCYFPIAIAVYQNRGHHISGNVLSFMQYHTSAPTGLVIAVNVMLILHLIGSYKVFAQPVFKFIEDRLFKIKSRRDHFKRFFVRFLYIVSATILAMIFPHFLALVGFFGGFAIAPTTYFLPCFIWLKLKKPKRWSQNWCLNWACIILGVLLMIVASVGGLYVLVKESSMTDNWKLWSPQWNSSLLYSTKNITSVDSRCRALPPSPPF